MPRRFFALAPTASVSGAERVLLRALAAAEARGWHVSCAAPEGDLARELADQGVEHIAIPELKPPSGPRILGIVGLLWRFLVAAIRVRRHVACSDIVLVNGLNALAPLRLLPRRPPVAWLVHDVVLRRDRRALVRVCAPAVTLAVAVSTAVADALRDYDFPTTVVRNGTSWPTDPADPVSPPVVGCNAALTSWKGQPVLLEAFSGLDRDDVVLELLGQGFPNDADYETELHHLVGELGLEGRVRFLGHVDDAMEQMRRWTVAVSASVEPEAAPLNVLEAMSLGVPVVATDHGGAPEVLGNGGLLVTPGDPRTLRRALETLLGDPETRGRCGSAGRQAIADGLTLDGQLDELLTTIESVSDRNAPPEVNADNRRGPRIRASRFKKKAAGALASARLVSTRRPSTDGGVILAYHDITAGDETHYDISAERFEKHLTLLERWGLEFVPLDDLVERSLAGRGAGLVSVTFDDGLIGVRRYALPVLTARRIPATVFVVSDLLGESPEWVRPGSRLLTSDELTDLAEAGVSIGSHTRTHASLTDCDDAALADELAGSRRMIADIVSVEPLDLAYPFGHYDARVVQAADDAGYGRAFSFRNGRVTPGLGVHRIPRLTMSSGHNSLRLAYGVSRPAWTWPDPQPDAIRGASHHGRSADGP